MIVANLEMELQEERERRMRYAILFIVCMVCVSIRTWYEILKKDGRVDLRNKVLFVGIASAMGLMLVSWFAMCPLDPLRVTPPAVLRWLGLLVVILGWILVLGGLIQLRGVENIDHLVTTGLFRKLRHPMYTGFACWIVGSIVYWGAVVSIIAGAVLVGNIIYWRELEERKMEADWGDSYRAYRLGTWL